MKSSLRIWKNLRWASLVTLLLSMAVVCVSAEGTTVQVYPESTTVSAPDETFSVNVTVTNVTDLYGWEVKLYWNNTLLNCTLAKIYAPDIWYNPSDPTEKWWFATGPGIQNNFNETHGMYHKGVTALDPAPSFNGSMTLITLTFKALAMGTCLLELDPDPTYGTILGNSKGKAIVRSIQDGDVTVLPEFQAAILMSLLMIATLVAIVLGKHVWSRKRRSLLVD